MRSIVLSGFMATGKSSVGRALAARLQVPFVDTNEMIERQAGKSLHVIWKEEGERGFRDREERVVTELLADASPQVIAFGGGTMMSTRLRHLAIDRAFVVTLTAEVATIAKRLGDSAERPALGANRASAIEELLSERSRSYAECHLTLSTDDRDPDEVADSIVPFAEKAPILVPFGPLSYLVEIGSGDQTQLTDRIATLAPSSIVVVTDSNVQRAAGKWLDHAMSSLAIPWTLCTLPSGESEKNLQSASLIWDAALGSGIDRDSLILAFGGGVVLDVAGFAASSLLRGIRTLLVPTTLLSMVDACVGGKTAIDHPVGKNLVGTFHQPSAVVIDLARLETLPSPDRIAGAAEMVKLALVSDAPLFEEIEKKAAVIGSCAPSELLPLVRACVKKKAEIVRTDERDEGPRLLLQLGHTVGHALESYGKYRRYRHGEAVAIGILRELQAGEKRGVTPTGTAARVEKLFLTMGLPTKVSVDEMRASLTHLTADKKRNLDHIRVPVVTAIGSAVIERITLKSWRDSLL